MRKKKSEMRQALNGYRIRREAACVLRESGTRLMLAEAAMLTVVPLILPFLLSSALQLAFYPLMMTGTWAQVLIRLGGALLGGGELLFLAFPLMTGLFGMAARIEAGEETSLSDLFCPFGSRSSYGRALLLSADFFWKICLSALAVWVSFVLVRLWGAARPTSLLLGGGVILLVLACSLLLLLSGFGASFTHLGVSIGQRARLRGRIRMGLGFFFGYMPSILLSILSIGVLLPADTLPRMLLGYFRYCRRWNEWTIRSEDMTDE